MTICTQQSICEKAAEIGTYTGAKSFLDPVTLLKQGYAMHFLKSSSTSVAIAHCLLNQLNGNSIIKIDSLTPTA